MLKRLLFLIPCFLALPLAAAQDAWNNPNANMSAGSVRPGHAQLHWSPGMTLPIRLRQGMITMVNLPMGETIDDVIAGDTGLFDAVRQGNNSMILQPQQNVQGGDTNMIVLGTSGNRYNFYVRVEPVNASEITHSQVDVIVDGFMHSGPAVASAGGGNAAPVGGSLLNRRRTPGATGTIGADGEDFGWIRSMRIDPAEFRFDLDIFVPNPDDFVIAPERVWRDRIFTYIDFGDKVIAMTQRPVVSLLIEGGESPVGFRTDGENGRLLIVEAVGDMVLRSGQRLVCIKQRGKPFLISDTASVMALAEANVARQQGQSFNAIGFGGIPISGHGNPAMMQQQQMMMMPGQPIMMNGGVMIPATGMPMMGSPSTGGGMGMNLLPQNRNTAGAFLPHTNVPIVSSNQVGVAVELRADTSPSALNDYWNRMLARFSGEDGSGLLTPFRDKVFFAVDEAGIGNLGDAGSVARLYRLRIGPMASIEEAQTLCDRLTRFSGTSCHVVRIQ